MPEHGKTKAPGVRRINGIRKNPKEMWGLRGAQTNWNVIAAEEALQLLDASSRLLLQPGHEQTPRLAQPFADTTAEDVRSVSRE